MMISSVLSALLALTAAQQVRDGVTAAQGAYTSCLSRFSQASLSDRKSTADFTTALPQQCTEQERAYREAMIRRDTASRIRRAEAEEAANEEIQYARQNVLEMYTESMTPPR